MLAWKRVVGFGLVGPGHTMGSEKARMVSVGERNHDSSVRIGRSLIKRASYSSYPARLARQG